jgi:MFS family permease
MIHEDMLDTQLERENFATTAVPAETERQGTGAGPSLPAQKKRGVSFFAPMRIGNFRLLISGQTISRLGDQFYFIAIPWLVLRATSSPIALALVLGFSSITLGVFTLIGGVLADRYGPRNLMLGADMGRLLIMSVLAALALFSTPPLWMIGLLSALLGLAGGLFYPASGAMTPHLVPSENLQAANSFEQLTFQSSNFVGPGIAGVILSATRLTFGFVVDAVSFLASVISLAAIRMPAARKEASNQSEQDGREAVKQQGGLAAFGVALAHLRRTPFLSMLFVLSFFGNFAIGGVLEIATPLLFKERVGVVAGPQAFGLAVAGFGLGSIIGAVAAGIVGNIRHKAAISLITILPCVVCISAVPFIHGTLAMAALFAGAGLFLGISNVLIITVVQTLIPLDMMGRMMSLVMLGSLVGSPLSIFAYGAAATIIPLPWLFVAGSSLLGIGALIGLAQKVTWQSI